MPLLSGANQGDIIMNVPTASLGGVSQAQQATLYRAQFSASATFTLSKPGSEDSAQFGSVTITASQSIDIVVERSLDKLRAVVSDAREALGLPEGATLDTSPEATAGRIADFALGAFQAFQDNHPELEGQDARTAFADLIGNAIEKGISEARDILTALSALTDETNSSIDTISQLIQDRLDNFVANGA
jgi:Domain of unknown function (DUF5610)